MTAVPSFSLPSSAKVRQSTPGESDICKTQRLPKIVPVLKVRNPPTVEGIAAQFFERIVHQLDPQELAILRSQARELQASLLEGEAASGRATLELFRLGYEREHLAEVIRDSPVVAVDVQTPLPSRTPAAQFFTQPEEAVMPSQPSTASLSHPRRRLLDLLQRLNFGRLESLIVRNREPVLDPQPVVIHEHKFAGENGPRPELATEDFLLKKQVVELFAFFDKLSDGVIDVLEIKHGLPFRMSVTEVPA